MYICIVMTEDRHYKIVYCTPALYMAGGVERVLSLKANYFANHFGYDITIILTEGKDKPYFYPLSDKITVINLDINFEELWTCSFLKKVFVYLKKQRCYKKKITSELMRLRPDITISLLRREINFITSIQDGSKKIGELHVNRANYRNFEKKEANILKNVFAKFWMNSLVRQLNKLDRFVTLTKEDKHQWPELNNIEVIPDPLSFHSEVKSSLINKRIIAVGRYVYQKGFDLLLKAWSQVEKNCTEWELVIYGQGDRVPYEMMIDKLGIDRNRCHLYGTTDDIKRELINSSIFVFSSRFEGFGMVIVEAMECGLPVVSFTCPCGPKDIVSNGIDGILVPNGDVSQLSDTILWLIKNPHEVGKMSLEAIKKSACYSMDVISSQWKDLFESVMSD